MVTSFRDLRDEKSFTDVTLACEGPTCKAHKMGLSACSPYLKSLLEENPSKHPIIILKYVSYIHLQAILEFMYAGEVYVLQEQLPAFLKTADRLKVKGLAEMLTSIKREEDSYTQFKAMLISLSLHLILLMFELLACDRLTSGWHLWVLVFIPLIFGSVASVGACVWAVKHDRSCKLELFLAVNALQFVSLPLKLDGFVSWSWEVVFVPLWKQTVPLDSNVQLDDFDKNDKKNKTALSKKNDHLKPVVPIVSIGLPD